MLDPFGGLRGDMQAGIVASTIWNVNVKPAHRLKPLDFMPRFESASGEERTGMTQQEILDYIKARFGGAKHG